MGCSISKLDDEEAVQLCNDRKKFIKQAVEQILKFALSHIAYIQSMKRVSVALREYNVIIQFLAEEIKILEGKAHDKAEGESTKDVPALQEKRS